MPRPIWSGTITFGLVTLPIRVLSATESHAISFRQIHKADGGRIRYRRVCELEDREVPEWEIGKGYQVGRDQAVPLTEDDLHALPIASARTIEIVAFVPADRIDPIQMSSGYYLESASPAATKPYALLAKALQRSERVAIAKFAWTGRERLGMLRVLDGVLVLQSLLWRDEVRTPRDIAPGQVDIDDAELDAALALMDALGAEDLSGHRDAYTDELTRLIEAKQEGAQPAAVVESPPARVVGLMEALNDSVERARRARGEDATVHEMPRKRAAKKAAAGKTKKSAPRRPKRSS